MTTLLQVSILYILTILLIIKYLKINIVYPISSTNAMIRLD